MIVGGCAVPSQRSVTVRSEEEPGQYERQTARTMAVGDKP